MVPRAAKYLSPIFETSDKYPLSKNLAGIFQYLAKNNTRGEKASDTIDIVSPDLCDDVFHYVGHTLEDHKGCDIIDIHPGACLWSQRLHDFLQPRRHLLMEPEDKYKPFYEPLLKTPGSTYRHTTLSGAHPKNYFESYDQIFNDELLPRRDLLPAGDPRLRQMNKTLLVTGTLSRRYRSVRGMTNNVHNANLLLNHMIHSSQTNALFHGYGLVRMLFWHPEDTKPSVMPDMAVSRGGYCAAIEVAADITEIAGRDRTAGVVPEPDQKRLLSRYRHPEIDQVGADKVLKRMNSKGMSMPTHRRSLLHQTALDRQEDPAIDVESEERRIIPIGLPDRLSVDEAIKWHEEKIKEFSTFLAQGKRSGLELPYRFKFTEGAKKVFAEGDLVRIGPFMDLWGVQLALEAAVEAGCRSEVVDSQTANRKSIVLKLAQELHGVFLDKRFGAKMTRAHAHTLQNEIQAFNVGLLAHDRRQYEALTVEAEEFWPPFGLFLLDIQPRSEMLGDDMTSAAQANATMRELVSSLWQLSASSVHTAMGRMGANAAEDLLPAAADMTDASKGGRLDTEDMSVRLLSREMIEQLTKAYLDWPFRPTDGR